MSETRKVDWRKKALVYDGLEITSLNPDTSVEPGELGSAVRADADLLKYRNRTLDAEAFWFYHGVGRDARAMGAC
jgi:hypothetical protein